MIKNFVKKFLKIDDNVVASHEYYDFSIEEWEFVKSVEKFTMTSYERLVTLIRSVKYLELNRIEGDFVECGVWKGGSVMTMIKVLQSLKSEERKFWLYDTFQGMTEPKDIDSKYDDIKAKVLLNKDPFRKSTVWAVSSLDEVKSNIGLLGYNPSKLNFIEGPVEETLVDIDIDKIALLRLDTDWYESTKIELETLFPKLVKGGVLIIDDYGHWKGCKQAVDEYFAKLDYPIFLNRIDYTGRIFIKYW